MKWLDRWLLRNSTLCEIFSRVSGLVVLFLYTVYNFFESERSSDFVLYTVRNFSRVRDLVIFMIQGGEDAWDAVSLKATFRKKTL